MNQLQSQYFMLWFQELMLLKYSRIKVVFFNASFTSHYALWILIIWKNLTKQIDKALISPQTSSFQHIILYNMYLSFMNVYSLKESHLT